MTRFIHNYLFVGICGLFAATAPLMVSGYTVNDDEVVGDLNDAGVTPAQLAQSLLGPNVEVRSVNYTGALKQAGFITNYGDIIGIDEAVLLSSGDVNKILGRNKNNSTTTNANLVPVEDADFFELNDKKYTKDESILEVEFVPLPGQTQLTLEYVFGSDEYESDNSSMKYRSNDFMAILVNGVNCAEVNGAPVGVNSVSSEVNAELYVDNRYRLIRSDYNTEMDGFTKVLTCTAPLVEGEPNFLEIGVVDAGPTYSPVSGIDPSSSSVDSWAFIKAVYTERLLNNDLDDLPNYLDPDDDNDGIPDEVEGNYDVDGDGLPNGFDLDSDGDSENDETECASAQACLDSDQDGIADFVDVDDRGNGPGDSDGDGIDDNTECPTPGVNGETCRDSDYDLIPDYSDEDSNNNGINDDEECADTGNGCVDENGDGVPDYLEYTNDDTGNLDSDGDGILDVDECQGSIENCGDQDGDGIPDYLDAVDGDGTGDADGDGKTDIEECPEQRNCDEDGDGVLDHLDAIDGSGSDDSDGDGTSNEEECPQQRNCHDSDGDGIPDYLDAVDGDGAGDADGDGKTDLQECPQQRQCPDQDSDGIPDYLDAVDGDGTGDADGDGKTDLQECPQQRQCPDQDSDGIPDYLDAVDGDGTGDADGDGKTDLQECPQQRQCPDQDSDGIPDYLDNSTARNLGASSDANQKVKVGVNGIGSINVGFLILLVSSGLWRFNKKKISIKFQGKSFVSAFALPVVFISVGVTSAMSGQAEAASLFDKGRYSGFYVGLGLGPSFLEPDVSGSPYKLDDDQDFGVKILAGYDVLDQLSVELAIAKLGEAKLDPSGSIEYSPISASAIYHLLGQHERSVFVKAGLATLNTSNGVPTEEENDYQLMLGLGGEWAFNQGWSLRAELESYDEDASQLSVGIVKRFNDKKREQAVVQQVPTQTESPVLKIEALEVAESQVNTQEICAEITQVEECIVPPVEEQKENCSVLIGRIDGIYFELNRADLTTSAEAVLDEASAVLKLCPSLKIEIHAHADNVGTEENNLVLSHHRANAVRLHLASRGIVLSRMEIQGFGESQPIADNLTEEGRALNRRVEFHLSEINNDTLISSDE